MPSTSTKFPVHNLESAPSESRETLEKLKASVGMIPNLAAAMSESPILIQGFATLREITGSGSLDPQIREIVLLSNAGFNQCRYCTAIHSTFALGGGIDEAAVEAVRSGGLPDDSKMKAAVKFSRLLLERRGGVSDEELEEFLAAGFERSHALEIVALIAQSIMANFSGHLTAAPPDDAIRAQYR
jgi:AhpD family alkylhydroperoxidase